MPSPQMSAHMCMNMYISRASKMLIAFDLPVPVLRICLSWDLITTATPGILKAETLLFNIKKG